MDIEKKDLTKCSTCDGKKESFKGKLSGYCSDCRRARCKLYRANNKEKLKAYNKQYHFKRTEPIRKQKDIALVKSLLAKLL